MLVEVTKMRLPTTQVLLAPQMAGNTHWLEVVQVVGQRPFVPAQ